MAMRRSWPGWLLLAALALHGWTMGAQNWPHLLWSCHVASACLALGILLRVRTAVASGFLFHLAIGFPAWLFEVMITRGTFGAPAVNWPVLATSVVVHLLPIAAGAWWLRFPRGAMPRVAVPLAWLLQVGMIPVSRVITPPHLNVNFAHGVWPGVTAIFPRLWIFQATIALLSAVGIVLVAGAIQWKWRPFLGARADALAETVPLKGLGRR